ncbi:hypothetical protein J7E71_19195 [Mesobacillus foraminis]|uniref:hypothetical protein n=1 Tax=Mesobacillus foraminis TaxID=279826 RepID=UPI001BE66087|nr:hypothetical protein [Mesobacillus foraminis]MBT2758000.1 hypothetical protein [Mesobacillus foraminis]
MRPGIGNTWSFREKSPKRNVNEKEDGKTNPSITDRNKANSEHHPSNARNPKSPKVSYTPDQRANSIRTRIATVSPKRDQKTGDMPEGRREATVSKANVHYQHAGAEHNEFRNKKPDMGGMGGFQQSGKRQIIPNKSITKWEPSNRSIPKERRRLTVR